VSAVRHWLGLNEKDPRLADVRVRQAISYAIDRKALINVAYHGIGRPARFGLSQFFTFPQPPPSQQFQYNPTKAKSLLAAAGYPNGFKLQMIYNLSRPGPVASSLAVLLKTMLGQVGIDVDLRLIAGGADFTTAFTSGNYQSVIYSENAVILDPTFNLANFTNNGSPNDSINFNNAQWDAAMDGAKFSTPGSPQQAKYLNTLARMGVSEVPIAYLADVFNPYAFSSNVTGLVNDPTGSIFPNYLSMR
jgi:peptide/nickel transport system substrate-binding protein